MELKLISIGLKQDYSTVNRAKTSNFNGDFWRFFGEKISKDLGLLNRSLRQRILSPIESLFPSGFNQDLDQRRIPSGVLSCSFFFFSFFLPLPKLFQLFQHVRSTCWPRFFFFFFFFFFFIVSDALKDGLGITLVLLCILLTAKIGHVI